MLLALAVFGRLPGRERERRKLERGKKLRTSKLAAGSVTVGIIASEASVCCSSTTGLTRPSFSGGVAVMRSKEVYAISN
jgi:hypothetical protein